MDFDQAMKKTPAAKTAGVIFWWSHKGSNLGPADYESAALTN